MRYLGGYAKERAGMTGGGAGGGGERVREKGGNTKVDPVHQSSSVYSNSHGQQQHSTAVARMKSGMRM